MKGEKQFQVSQDYVHKSLTQPLAQAKMTINRFGNRNFMLPMGRLIMPR
jgi:hypothetical protein